MSRVEDVYADRSILLTGASGFLGKVLVEKILYSVPTVKNIYLLIRPQKGLTPRQRLEKIIEGPLFSRIREKKPEVLQKLIPVEGNLMEDGLGLNQHDMQSICDDVSIVIHCAATVKFDEQLRNAVEMNVLGTQRLIALCHRMRNLISVVHASTAYANCDRPETEEKIYEPPVPPNKLLEALEWMDDEMIALITPKLLGKRPNTYTLTKALAEVQLVEDSKQLPVILIRPSIIGAMWRDPLPGWTDNVNGPTGIFAAVGKGVLTNMCGSVNSKADIIPVDIVSNMIIVAAAHRATNKYSEIPVMHCASGDLNPIYWDRIVNYLQVFYHEFPMEDCYRVPSTHFHRSRSLFEFNYNYKHHYPAHVADMIAALLGQRKKYVKLYGKVWKMIETLHYFTTRGWTFKSKALPALWETVHPDDKEVFNFDVRQVDWDSYLFDYLMGIKLYLLNEKIDNIPLAQKKLKTMKFVNALLNAAFWYGVVRFFGKRYTRNQKLGVWALGFFGTYAFQNANLRPAVQLKTLEEYKRSSYLT